MLAALVATLFFTGGSQAWADHPQHFHHGHYRHDAHGYWDEHHAYHHYVYWHSHPGYWGYDNGVQVFFILDDDDD